jgi:hypothetical protein
VRFSTTGPETERGITVTGKLLHPVNLLIISLWEANDLSRQSGPRITYQAKNGTPGTINVDAGITIIGRYFPNSHICYAKAQADGAPCLQVKVTVDSPTVKNGSVDVCLEFVEIQNRTHVRLNGIPLTEIIDAFDGAKLVNKIRELTEKDPCKEIDIPSK